MKRSVATSSSPSKALRTTLPDWICLAIFVWFASYVDQYIYSINGLPPLYSQIAALGLLVSIAAGRLTVRGAPPANARINRLLVVITFYVAWTITAYLYSSQSEIAGQLLITRLKIAAFIPLAAFALDRPSMTRPFAALCAALVIVGAGLNVVDFINPTFSNVPGRAAGLYANPNTSGLMLVCLGVIATRALTFPLRHAMWAIIALAVFLTFSRAAWLYLLIAIVYLSWLGELGLGRARILFAASIVVGIGVIASLLLSGTLYQFVIDTPIVGYLDPNTTARLGAGGVLFTDYSSTERDDVLRLGLARFWESPLLGHGLAFTHEWEARASTHNMYVLMLAEGGVVGLAVYLILLATLLHKTSGVSRLLAILIVVAGFASHNLLDAFGEGVMLAALAAGLRYPLNPRDARHL